MRNAALLVVSAVGVLATGAASVAAPTPASATLSSNKAGARPVALTVTLQTELKCGRLTGTSVALRLPAAAKIPATISPSAVLVAGKTASGVRVSGHTLVVGLGVPSGYAQCNSITVGVAKIVVTRAAGLGNPAAPGSYRVTVDHGGETFAAPLTIR